MSLTQKKLAIKAVRQAEEAMRLALKQAEEAGLTYMVDDMCDEVSIQFYTPMTEKEVADFDRKYPPGSLIRKTVYGSF